MQQIHGIVGPGNSDNILPDAMEGGFAALDRYLVNKLSLMLCRQPCDHVLHETEQAEILEVMKSHHR